MSANKYSYSSLSCFEQCPYKYKLIYVDNHYINCPSIATDFGTLIHHIEEEIGNYLKDNKTPPYKGLVDEFQTEIDKIKHNYPDAFYSLDKSNRTYADKSAEYLNTGIYRLEKRMQNNPSLEIVGLEKEFYLDYKSYLFHGFIDRIFYDKKKDEYIIEDIKTYPKPLSKKDLQTPLQHLIYSLALDPNNEYKVHCTYDLPLCDIIQGVADDYRERGIRKLDSVFDDLKYTDFKPNPTPLCHWCVFSHTYPNQPKEAKGLCPYYSLWTKENKTFRANYKWLGYNKHEKILEQFRQNIESGQIL